MPRDSDKHNDSPRGRRDRPAGGKSRSGKPRGPDKKFAKRGIEGKKFDGERGGDKPRFSRDDRPRGDRPFRDRPARDGDGEKRAFKPRGDRPKFNREGGRSRDSGDRNRDPGDRGGQRRSYKPREDRGDDRRPHAPRTHRDEDRPAARFSDRKSGDKKPYAARERDGDKRPYKPRGEGFRKDGDRPRGDRPYSPRPPRDGDRSDRKFGGERKFDRGADRNRDRGPRKDFRKDFGDRPSRGESKPWQKREEGFERPARRDSERKFDRPKFDKPRYDKPRDRDRGSDPGDRGGDERPRFSRPREDGERSERSFRERPKFDRPRDRNDDRPKFDRPRSPRDDRPRDRKSDPGRPEGRRDWQEHPRSERGADRKSDRGFADRPRRDNEDDSKVFAKRPAFGGRGGYREPKKDFGKRDFDKRAPREEPKPKKAGERIAKVLARAGLASRRDAEEMVVQGRVTVNGRVINSPALDVTANDVVAVDGAVLPPRERTRLFMYHKPKGLMTTHADPEGRPTVFDNLPEGLPRLISVGRLDFNTEGLLLLTNDGGLARALELPDTGWLRRYRVRAHGEITQAQLDQLKDGIEVDGVKYGSIDATLERDQGSNVWLVFAIREGKNREVRNVMAHLGLEVNRLIRVSYGPFQLGELAEGQVDEVKTRVLREQLGEKVIAQAGAEFAAPEQRENGEGDAPRGKKPFKASGKNAILSDRKGRRVLVQRTGSEEARARNEDEAAGYGPPRRPKRGYHGKRDLKPRDE
jgi:23S rRNA pseudouridine2605 synthase